jgi:hypothetical protein
VFQPGETQPKPFSAWTNGQPPRYRARTEVHFDDHGPWPGPPTWTGDWQTSQSLDFVAHPLSGVPKIEFEISPGQLAFAETPQAQVDVRIDGAVAGTHMLTADHPTATFRRRLEPAATGRVESRVTWFLTGGHRVEGEWLPVEGTTLLVHGPWRSTRSLRLLPLLPADFLDALVTVTLTESSAQPIELRFDPGDRRAKQVNIPSLSEPPPPVKVDTLVIRGDGSTFSGQPVVTSDPVVLVRDRDGDFRQLGVRLLAGPTLAGHGLMAVQVQLLDEGGEPTDSVVFTESQRGPGLLLVPAPADGAHSRYRVIRYALNGAAVEGQPQDVTGAELLVPAVVHP